MIYTLEGEIKERGENYFILDLNGIGFKVFGSSSMLNSLPPFGRQVKVFCFLYLREQEQFELYGFLREEALKLFEMLNSVAGVGPKTALSILGTDSVENIMAAIIEKRAELLTRASGIGQKTAERVILELHNKIKLPKAKALTESMELNLEVEEALVGLGYGRSEVKKVLESAPAEERTLEGRLRFALKSLSRSQ